MKYKKKKKKNGFSCWFLQKEKRTVRRFEHVREKNQKKGKTRANFVRLIWKRFKKKQVWKVILKIISTKVFFSISFVSSFEYKYRVNCFFLLSLCKYTFTSIGRYGMSHDFENCSSTFNRAFDKQICFFFKKNHLSSSKMVVSWAQSWEYSAVCCFVLSFDLEGMQDAYSGFCSLFFKI